MDQDNLQNFENENTPAEELETMSAYSAQEQSLPSDNEIIDSPSESSAFASPDTAEIEEPEIPSSSYTYSSTKESYTPPREKKQKKSSWLPILAACLAVLCVFCCGAAGYLGAKYAVRKTPTSPVDPDTPLVMYRNPEYSDNAPTVYTTTADVAQAVHNTVVEITTEETLMSSLYQYVQNGAGSGVIISKDGYILTCNHVVASSSGSGFVSAVTVTLTNGKQYSAKIVGSDSDTDLALLKVEPEEELTPAVFPPEDATLVIGETVIAIGNPLGKLGGSVSSGIISALERRITVGSETMTLLQTDTAINPGNSGGGLFNMKGELIGIVNAKSVSEGIEGLGFAIPTTKALPVIEQLVTYGYVRGKPYVGLVMRDVTDISTAYYLYRRRATGVYIDSIVKGTNDDVLKPGDRVVAVNGKEITASSEVKTMIQECKVGDTMQFTISRANGNNSELITVEIKIFEYIPSGIVVNYNQD